MSENALLKTTVFSCHTISKIKLKLAVLPAIGFKESYFLQTNVTSSKVKTFV